MTGVFVVVAPHELFAIESKNADQFHLPLVVGLFVCTALIAAAILAPPISYLLFRLLHLQFCNLLQHSIALETGIC